MMVVWCQELSYSVESWLSILVILDYLHYQETGALVPAFDDTLTLVKTLL